MRDGGDARVLTAHTQVPVVAETLAQGERGGQRGEEGRRVSPRWLRIFFRRSKSSRILESSTVDVACSTPGEKGGGGRFQAVMNRGGAATLKAMRCPQQGRGE